MISIKTIKRIAILVVGSTVLAIGVALLVLPGPAFIVIPVGLAILAVEFAWARRWLRKARELLPNTNGAGGLWRPRQSGKAKRTAFKAACRVAVMGRPNDEENTARTLLDRAISGEPADFARLAAAEPISGARALEIVATKK